MGRKEKNTGNTKIGLIHSIKFKISFIVATGVLLTTLVILFVLLPRVSEDILKLNSNYLYDITVSNGALMENMIGDVGKGNVTAERWEQAYKNVGIEGISSSYAYVIDQDGMFLYHPTPEKIGTKVENEVVNGVIKEIAAGKHPETTVEEYLYQGVWKYAAYYVSKDNGNVLVVCADQDEMLTSTNEIKKVGIGIGVFAVILFTLLGYFVTNVCIRPVVRVSEIIAKMANLDFTENEDAAKLVGRKDETGKMSRAVADLRKEMVSMVKSIQQRSKDLLQASDTLSADASDTAATIQQVENAVSDIATGATSQAEETQTATENVITMGNMIGETSQEVEQLRKNATVMQEASESSMEILKELVSVNEKTKDSIDDIYRQTHTTNESAMKIKDATDMITSIAEETNLLSLNASIEAARAGEQGKGFAVVASQIQKLAEQSNVSAQHIGEIINALIDDSNKAVETMQVVKTIMEEQTNKMTATNEMFGKVDEGIIKSSGNIQNIGDKTESLDGARGSVVDIVQNLSAIAEENAASSEETSASVIQVGEIVVNISENATELEHIATELDEHVKAFKI